MTNSKPLTKKDLLIALKDIPRKKEVRQIVKDEVFHQMSGFHAKMTMPKLEKLQKDLRQGFGKVGDRLRKVESGLVKVEADITFIKRDIGDIKVNVSDTPTKKEHEELKSRVDKYHPLS